MFTRSQGCGVNAIIRGKHGKGFRGDGTVCILIAVVGVESIHVLKFIDLCAHTHTSLIIF